MRRARARCSWCGGLAHLSSTGLRCGSLVLGTYTDCTTGRPCCASPLVRTACYYLLPFVCFVLVPIAFCPLHSSCTCTLVLAITTCYPLSCLLSLLLSFLPVLAYSLAVLVPVR